MSKMVVKVSDECNEVNINCNNKLSISQVMYSINNHNSILTNEKNNIKKI